MQLGSTHFGMSKTGVTTRERRQARSFLRNKGLKPTREETINFAGTAKIMGRTFQDTFEFMGKISTMAEKPDGGHPQSERRES